MGDTLSNRMNADLTIFVCYRRSDTSGEAVALTDKLNRRRGFDVFKDVDNIRPGQDWLDAIEESMDRCDVLLVLIGRDWIGRAGDEGHGLDENDHVRREIEAALARGKAVIPILFEMAELPRSADLPESLRPLVRRQALRIRNATFNRDVELLVSQLRLIQRQTEQSGAGAIATRPPPPPPPPPTRELPPPPPTHEPQTGVAGSIPRRGPSAMLLGVVALLVVLIAAVGLAYTLHIGPFTAAAATPTPISTPNEIAAQSLAALKKNVPASIVGSCQDQSGTSNAYAGSTASLACSTTGVDGIYYDLFPNLGALLEFYATEVTSVGAVTSEKTTCETGNLDIAYHFTFTGGTQLGGAGYRLICFRSGATPPKAWIEQAHPADLMMITIQRNDGDQGALWQWWMTTHVSVEASPSPSP